MTKKFLKNEMKYDVGSYGCLLSNENEIFSFDILEDRKASHFVTIQFSEGVEAKGCFINFTMFTIEKEDFDYEHFEDDLELDNCFSPVSIPVIESLIDKSAKENKFLLISLYVSEHHLEKIRFSDVRLIDFNGWTVDGRVVTLFPGKHEKTIGVFIVVNEKKHPMALLYS